MSSSSALDSLLGLTSSTSGIDISSILQAAMGASSTGIDVTSAVNAAVTAASAPETAWTNDEATLQSQTTALDQLQTDVSNLENDLTSLNDIGGPLNASVVSSSDDTVLTGTAASGSAVGDNSITVNALATNASWASTTVASSSTVLGSGSFTVTPATGTAATFTTDGTTFSDLATQINSAGLGVTATVITDTTGARLAITSNDSGAAANFSVSAPSSASVQFTQPTTGQDASLVVNGIQIDSASNTVTGALPGVTLNLLNAAPGTNVSLTVAPDVSQASTAINQFVTDYNTMVQDLNTQFTFSGSSEGVLAQDPVVCALQTDILDASTYTYTPTSGTTTVSSLASLGISVQNDGTLAVDSTTLSQALQNNPADVQNFFQGTAFNGFAQSMENQLSTFTDPSSGAFTVDLQSIQAQNTDLQNDITNFQTNYIVPLQTQLQSEYSQAEILLQQLPSQLNQINEMLGVNTNSSS